ncbi:MAG: hypothetical protein AAGI06_16425, partial [Pseudomonadota bacterium]
MLKTLTLRSVLSVLALGAAVLGAPEHARAQTPGDTIGDLIKDVVIPRAKPEGLATRNVAA